MAASGVPVRVLSRPQDPALDVLSGTILSLATAAWHVADTPAHVLESKQANVVMKMAKALRLVLATEEVSLVDELLLGIEVTISGVDDPLVFAILGRLARIRTELGLERRSRREG